MSLSRIHYFSGLLLTAFCALHLSQHLTVLAGPAAHLQWMELLRPVYRNPISETLLLASVLMQILSGLRLLRGRRGQVLPRWERIRRYSGLYLAVFLLIHVGAVLAGRYLLHLDTNVWFAAAGLNTFPFYLFFVPYYVLAVTAVAAHLAAVHQQKMRRKLLGLAPEQQAWVLLAGGLVWGLLIVAGMTAGFTGREIPEAYGVLVGR